MNDEDRKKITVDKSKEARKPGISKMISEGGLGADKYYHIKKEDSEPEKKEDEEE